MNALESKVLSSQDEIEAAIETLLKALGEDPAREGLRDTPARVARMYREVFRGLHEDPLKHLETQFSADGHEELVIVKDITFFSMCEHHLLPFFGKAHIAYLPDGGRLAGLSKLARVTQTIAARPQLQERMSAQIADALEQALGARGVMVKLEAEHMCMAMRGARADGSKTVTLVTRGELSDNPERRAETLKLLQD
ncbi:GTP cyclohydrolase I [Actibacterium atlanticum]|uniref:GTP cyclohydrolase 1 n=1 Tax=Actibacterium atlanticum TaxID=1461693 RepID=A0A058ZI19_9RHOB|nr:GTP cyclohydrolase I FolE [Actibacterium atlanticum]KCV80880.1 GTP cyclohydrolase I [Actibacterium atlanticum]